MDAYSGGYVPWTEATYNPELDDDDARVDDDDDALIYDDSSGEGSDDDLNDADSGGHVRIVAYRREGETEPTIIRRFDDDYLNDANQSDEYGVYSSGLMTRIIPDSTGMEYSQLLSKYEGEDVDRRGMDGLYWDPDPTVTTRTHYMDAEEREDYRLNVNEEGKLVDSEGRLYASSQSTHGHYPGSTGGDLFVMDQGGLFAGDLDQMQQGATENQGLNVIEVVHHSTLAAGQREGGDDQSPLRVFGAGEIVAQDGEVRSISDASGHFRPDTSDTVQVVETLEEHGVNLDNTKINLVGKSEYDDDGNVPSIDIYSGEFKEAEGDQRTLTNKRAVMDEIRDTLSERRKALDDEAEERAQLYSTPDENRDQNSAQATAEDDDEDDDLDDHPIDGVDRGYAMPGDQVPDVTVEDVLHRSSFQEGIAGDSSAEESDEDAAQWQSAQSGQGERSAFTIGGQRGVEGAASTEESSEDAGQWQSAEAQQGERSDFTIGAERETPSTTWQSARPQGPRIGTHRG
jgi:hypothetical protein